MKDLHLKLQRLQGKAYGTYNDLRGHSWSSGDFEWNWVHIQGDPYAPPSRMRISVALKDLGIPEEWVTREVQRVALADFLLRRLALSCATQARSLGTGNGGLLATVEPGPEILKRNSCRIENGKVHALIQVGLPADARKIESAWAIEVLCQRLPEALTESLYCANFRLVDCERAIRNLEIQRALRDSLDSLGLVAFVGDHAVLPRASGTSVLPLRGARPFKAPEGLQVEIEVMGERFKGLGIPKGITVIAGGGFQGKSTLLSAVEIGVYDHVMGDGRERVVTDPTAFKIRSEEGRQVLGSCIEPLVRHLPGGKNTRFFNTTLASGSTSQAANLVEAIGLGVRTMLVDEDISAVNFLIRDERMRRLIRQDREPLIPLVSRIQEFRDQLGLNFVMVIGACGDYLRVADTVIVMEEWEPRLATEEARIALGDHAEVVPQESYPDFPKDWTHSLDAIGKHLKNGLRPASAVEKGIKVKANAQRLQLGRLQADVTKLSQFVCVEQIRSAGAAALNILLTGKQGPLEDAVAGGSAALSFPEGLDLADVRPQELGAAILRLAEME